jgi:hypothetical protein
MFGDGILSWVKKLRKRVSFKEVVKLLKKPKLRGKNSSIGYWGNSLVDTD